MVRYLVQEHEVSIRDERGAEMFGKDRIDESNVRRECRAGITRGCDRNLSGGSATGTLEREDRCVTVITPAYEDLPQIRRGHFCIISSFRNKCLMTRDGCELDTSRCFLELTNCVGATRFYEWGLHQSQDQNAGNFLGRMDVSHECTGTFMIPMSPRGRID
jgi:hypothetical protein